MTSFELGRSLFNGFAERILDFIQLMRRIRMFTILVLVSIFSTALSYHGMSKPNTTTNCNNWNKEIFWENEDLTKIVRNCMYWGQDYSTSGKRYIPTTPLHYAAKYDAVEAAKIIVTNIGIPHDVRDEDGRTPLHIAAEVGSGVAMADVLIHNGQTYRQMRANYRRNRRELRENRKGYREILKEEQRSPSVRDDAYRRVVNALNSLDVQQIIVGRIEMAKVALFDIEEKLDILRDERSDLNKLHRAYIAIQDDDKKSSAAHLAASAQESVDFIRLLDDIERDILFLEDEFDRVPLHYAAWSGGEPGFFNALLHIDDDVNPSHRDVFGMTPLHYAAMENNFSEVMLLLRAGANADDRDNFGGLKGEERTVLVERDDWIKEDRLNHGWGWTPLQWALFGDADNKVVEILLANMTSIDITDDHGKTPLLLAAELSDEEVICLLFLKGYHEYNGEVNNIIDNDGQNLADIAAKNDEVTDSQIKRHGISTQTCSRHL